MKNNMKQLTVKDRLKTSTHEMHFAVASPTPLKITRRQFGSYNMNF